MLAFLIPVWSALSGFFRSPLGKYVAIAMAVLGLLGAVWWAGDHHGHSAEKAAQARAVAAARAKLAKTDRSIAEVVAPIRQQTEATRVEIRTVTKTLIKEVPTYVTPKADAACTVPLGFVRLYNSAAGADGAEVPGPSSGPDDAGSGVALHTVAETDVANLGTAREALAEVRAWRDWYPKVRALYEKAAPP